MIRVGEMSSADITSLLECVGYGHLACSRYNVPYVVPIHYVYKSPDIYVFTTEGRKSEIIDGNSQVCLQVEQVTDEKSWKSVIIEGKAKQLADKEEINEAMKLILAANPELTPALSIHWMDQWVRENREIVYRIAPETIAGRMTMAN